MKIEGLLAELAAVIGPGLLRIEDFLEEGRLTFGPFASVRYPVPVIQDGSGAWALDDRLEPHLEAPLGLEPLGPEMAKLLRHTARVMRDATHGAVTFYNGKWEVRLRTEDVQTAVAMSDKESEDRWAEVLPVVTIGPYSFDSDADFYRLALSTAKAELSMADPRDLKELLVVHGFNAQHEDADSITDSFLRFILDKYADEDVEHAGQSLDKEDSYNCYKTALLRWRQDSPVIQMIGPNGREVGVSVVAAIYPMVVLEDEGTGYFPVTTGLVFEQQEDLEAWPRPDRKRFFEALQSIFTSAVVSIIKDFKALPTPVLFEPREATGWSDGKTRVDLEALQVTCGLAQLSRTDSWERVPRLEDLEATAIEKLQEELGEEAFRGREAPLREVTVNRQTGETAFKLSSAKARELREEYGQRPGGFRELDRAGREYLVQCVETSGGLLETRVSWWGEAGPLFESYRKDQLAQAQEAVREAKEQPSLFEDLTQERKNRANAWLARMRCYDLGVALLHMALAEFGQEGLNPVAFLARDLRRSLGLDDDPNWKSQAEGALDGLTALVVQLRSAEGYRGGGPMLSWWEYFPAGPGRHGQGTYLLHLSAPAIGRLRHFATGATERLPYSKEEGLAVDATTYDWQREPSEEDVQEELGIGPKRRRSRRLRGPWYESYGGGLPHYATSEGLSPNQQTLLRKLDSQETLKGSGVANGPDGRPWTRRSGPRAEDRGQPRIYTSAFCPLLPEGRRYHGALGNFKGRGSEQGRTLGGRGGTGWLKELGYSLKRGRATKHNESVARQAIQDFQLVVVELLGGVVAAKYRGDWITVEVAQKLPLAVLLSEVTWFLFPPEGWLEDLRKRYEAKHGVLVSQSPAEARAVREGVLTGDTTLAPAGRSEDGQKQWPLYIQLQIAMKARELTQQAVAEFFGVSQSAVSRWLKGPEGRPIPQELRPMVKHWIATEEPPSREQLEARRNRRTGRRGS